MHTQIHVGLKIILITMIFVACSNPEREANKLFTEASRLLREASNVDEKQSFEAFSNVKQSKEMLTQITEKYPSSSIAVEISKGNLLLNGKTMEEIFDAPHTMEVFRELSLNNKLEKVQLVIDYHKNFNRSKLKEMLHSACFTGSDSCVQLLLKNGLNVNEELSFGDSPLNRAIDGCNFTTVKMLIEEGANIHDKDSDGDTPLANAIWSRMPDIASLLLQKGADINCRDQEGRTPLYVASLLGNLPTATLLVSSGANLNSHKGNSPLERAMAIEGNLKGFDNNGFTPLMVAAWNRNIEVVRLLLSAGANVEHKDNKGKKAIYYATTPQILKLLREAME